MSMSKVTETRTQDGLREAITPLNPGNYPHDLELHAKKTGQLEDLKINYVLNKRGPGFRHKKSCSALARQRNCLQSGLLARVEV